MLLVLSILVPLLAGGIVTLLARWRNWQNSYDEPLRITPIEFGVSALVIIVFAVPATLFWGPSAARASAANGYHQFYNGSLVYAGETRYTCERDGSCTHEYNCDPYEVQVAYTDQEYVGTDTNGNPEYETVTKYRTETRYHDCPYATEEDTYYLEDNLGRTIHVANHIFQTHPVEWRSGHSIPGGVAEGPPNEWLTDRQRLQDGDAPPVTMENNYTNYILPSDSSLKSYSSDIQQYQKAGLMPLHTQNLKNGPFYDLDTQASKFVSAGLTIPNASTWQDRLMRFDAALGMERQGDLHILAVPASKVTDPDDYLEAVKTYWLNDLGKWGFPKNGIMVILGVSDDGQTIQWARADTGMPIGNEDMLTAISFQLNGKPFDPDVLLGKITAQVQPAGDDYKVTYAHGTGLLDGIIFTQHPFLRACMNCKDKGDNGTSYVYLKDSIPVSMGAQVLTFFLILIGALALWAVALFFNPVGYFTGSKSSSVRTNDTYWRGL